VGITNHPLYRRRRLLRSSGRPIGGLPPPEQQSPAAVATPRPGSSAVASLVIAPSTPDATDEATVFSRATAEKEAADVAMTKKAADDAATAERAVADAAAEKKATYDAAAAESEAADAATKKAMDDAAVVAERAVRDKRATDPATEKKATGNVAVVEGATTEITSWGVAESSPTPMVGAKRTDVSGGSTPPAKHRFCGSWKPRYAVGPYICPSTLYAYLFHLDSSLCIVSPSSRTPTPRADQTHSSAMGHGP
jgi:hypothetical protein